MNIDRQNYEAIFLTYVDKELTATECAAVEAFVEQNPDLAPELEMLQQATLLPETELAFDNKALLYKTAEGIQLNNYELYFLLYVDDELNRADRAAVETFVLQHPQLQQQFTLLQQTKVDAETISFGDKSSLYRTTKKRVIPIGWMRMAAAAAVIGLIAIVYGIMPSATVVPPGPQVAVQPVKPTDQGIKKPAATPVNSGATVASQQDEIAAPGIPQTNKQLVTGANTTTSDKSRAQLAKRKGTIADESTDPLPATNNALAVNPAQPIPNEETLAPKINRRSSTSNNVAQVEPAITAFAATTPEKEAGFKQAVYRELNVEEAENENTILIGSAQINKNKLRGLLKKATGFLDKKSDNPDNDKRVKIAMFELR